MIIDPAAGLAGEFHSWTFLYIGRNFPGRYKAFVSGRRNVVLEVINGKLRKTLNVAAYLTVWRSKTVSGLWVNSLRLYRAPVDKAILCVKYRPHPLMNLFGLIFKSMWVTFSFLLLIKAVYENLLLLVLRD